MGGVSTCSQYCQNHVILANWPPADVNSGDALNGRVLGALAYTPPSGQDAETVAAVQAMLGTTFPEKPRSLATGAMRHLITETLNGEVSSSSYRGDHDQLRSDQVPSEPLNKVYVQFSNDLEGFLPYILVVSDAQGMEFRSSTEDYPDFALSPAHILHLKLLLRGDLERDAFFASLSKSVADKQRLEIDQMINFNFPQRVWQEDRSRPPYNSVAQLSIRRRNAEGGQVIVFIATQSTALLLELTRSCEAARRRLRQRPFESQAWSNCPPATNSNDDGIPSRGFPTPRTAAGTLVKSPITSSKSKQGEFPNLNVYDIGADSPSSS